MDERDCVLFISELKLYLVQFLKVTHAAGYSFFYWDDKQERIVLSNSIRKLCVRLSVALHLVYLVLQIYFTFESNASVAVKLVAAGLIAMTAMYLVGRWEMYPDEVHIHMINALLEQKLKNYGVKGEC